MTASANGPFPHAPACKSCGSPTRLEDVASHPSDALAHLIYRCPNCAVLIVSAGPRQTRTNPDAER